MLALGYFGHSRFLALWPTSDPLIFNDDLQTTIERLTIIFALMGLDRPRIPLILAPFTLGFPSAHFPERAADKAAIKSAFLLCVAGGMGMLPIRQRMTVFLILGFFACRESSGM